MKTTTLSKQDWLELAERILTAGNLMSVVVTQINGDGMGREDANDCLADFACAVAAIRYVAEYAPDKCVFAALEEKDVRT